MEIYVKSEKAVEDYKEGKLEVRGGRGGEGKVIRLKEILDSINDEISKSVKTPCEVKIEISGSITIGGEAGTKFFGILDIGGKGEKKDSVTISLTTKLNPEVS